LTAISSVSSSRVVRSLSEKSATSSFMNADSTAKFLDFEADAIVIILLPD
jgi:hypothetical protein